MTIKKLNNIKFGWDIFSLLIILTLIIIKHHAFIWGEYLFGPFGDTVYMLSPMASYVSDVWQMGEIPLWNQSILGGMELYNAPMVSITYPFYFWGWLDYGTDVQTMKVLVWIKIFHLCIHTVGVYVLGRLLSLRTLNSALMTMLYLSSAYLALCIKWVNWFTAFSWMPLFMVALYLLVQHRKALPGLALFSLVIVGISASPTAFFTPIYIGLLVVGASMIFKENRIDILKRCFALGVIGLCLAAVSLIPIIMESGNFLRFVGHGNPPLVGSEKVPLSSFVPELSLRYIDEFFYRPFTSRYKGVSHPYIGPIALFFGILGIILFIIKNNIRKKWFQSLLIIIALLSFLAAHGTTFGFTNIMYHLPLLDKMRHPVNHIYWFMLAMVFFSSYGVQVLDEYFNEFKTDKKYLGIVLAGALVWVASFIVAYQNFEAYSIYIAAAFGISLLLLLWHFKSDGRPLFFTLSMLLLSAILFFQPLRREASLSQYAYYKEDNLKSMDIFEQLSTKVNNYQDYRIVYDTNGFSDAKWSMNGSYFGFRSFQAKIVPIPADQFNEYAKNDKYKNYRLINGAKWFVERTPDSLSRHPIVSNNSYVVYENEEAYLRLYSARAVEKFNGKLKKYLLKTEKIDISRKKVFVHPKDFKKIKQKVPKKLPIQVNLQPISNTHNEFHYQSDAKKVSLLVWNEFYNDDNWKIYIDGERTETYEVNFNQIGFVVPSGKHDIKIQYSHKIFEYLYLLRKITMWGLFGIFVFFYLRNLKP